MVFAITSVLRGYHIYKDIWGAEISSELPCLSKPDNCEARYAVVVMDGTNVVSHVPRSWCSCYAYECCQLHIVTILLNSTATALLQLVN